MKTVISLTFLTFVVLSSLVSTAAQETAGAMPVRPALTDSNGAAKSAEPLLTEIYRVGVGDILDIRLINSLTNRSTLFTVLPSGAIDLPVAGGAVQVAGLTTEEIQVRIGAELKRRAVEDGAHISVGVRQYVSHSVMVTGLVVNPGTRFLRREAVPLYAVLAESQLRNDAGRVVVMRGGATGETLELSDPQTMNITIQAGDVITVSHKPQEFLLHRRPHQFSRPENISIRNNADAGAACCGRNHAAGKPRRNLARWSRRPVGYDSLSH